MCFGNGERRGGGERERESERERERKVKIKKEGATARKWGGKDR